MKELQEEIQLIKELMTVNRIKRREAAGRSMLNNFDTKYAILTRILVKLEGDISKEVEKEKQIEKAKQAQITIF